MEEVIIQKKINSLFSLLGTDIKIGDRYYLIDGFRLSTNEWYLLDKTDRGIMPKIYTTDELWHLINLRMYFNFVAKANKSLSIGEITEAYNRTKQQES